jgi:hypothetical protein
MCGAFTWGKSSAFKARMFFFEKKNQKTFVRCRGPVPQGAPEKAKVFCFFFSKKKTFLLSLAVQIPCLAKTDD